MLQSLTSTRELVSKAHSSTSRGHTTSPALLSAPTHTHTKVVTRHTAYIARNQWNNTSMWLEWRCLFVKGTRTATMHTPSKSQTVWIRLKNSWWMHWPIVCTIISNLQRTATSGQTTANVAIWVVELEFLMINIWSTSEVTHHTHTHTDSSTTNFYHVHSQTQNNHVNTVNITLWLHMHVTCSH